MNYSENELYIIQKKRPDLIRKPDPSTNTAIKAFLKKYFLIDQIPKDNSSEEWALLRQRALDHKDFPKFQTDHFNEVTEYNKKIEKILEDPRTKNYLDSLIKKYSFSKKFRKYINPLYYYYKYHKNTKSIIEKILHKINFAFWVYFILILLIFLIFKYL